MEVEKKLYPLLFEPIAEDQEGSVVQLADLGYQDSAIRNGWLSTDTIGEVMDTYMERVVGDDVFNYYGRQFPVCIKTLSVDGHSPLLVCPGDEVAEQRFDFLGKAKLWYVISAEPGAKVYLGFGRDVDSSEFYDACMDGSVEGLLHAVEPSPGDCFMVRPGTVHCMSGRITVCEIAESSPLDFRLFGWGVPDPDSESNLNLETAFDFIDYKKYEACNTAGEGGILASVPQFVVTARRISEPVRVSAGASDSFAAYTCVAGEAAVVVPEDDAQPAGALSQTVVRRGETVLVPADVAEFHIIARASGTVLLETTVPPRPQSDSYTGGLEDDNEPAEELYN